MYVLDENVVSYGKIIFNELYTKIFGKIIENMMMRKNVSSLRPKFWVV